MFDKYSPDEGLVLIAAGIISLVAWGWWYYALGRVGNRVRPSGPRWPLAWAPLVGLGVLYVVLRRWAAEDVSYDPAYILFYLVVGAAWLAVIRGLLPSFGLSVRDDVLERGNPAATWAISGALVGCCLCYAGGNVGNGPGWWVVLFAALLATAMLFFLWWVVARAAGLAETITVERDAAAGLRAAGFFLGTGMVLGRAVAGDWVSVEATLSDFARMGWPAAVLAAAAIVGERWCRPAADRSALSLFNAGAVPALVYVAAGVVLLLAVGR
jgi:hypothetical protein